MIVYPIALIKYAGFFTIFKTQIIRMRYSYIVFTALFICTMAKAQDHQVEYEYPDGYKLVYTGKTEKLYGVIDENDKIVIPVQFKKIRPVGEKGIFEVKDKTSKAGLYSAVQQKLLVEPIFYEFENFQEGLVVVKKNKPDHGFLWGAYDVNGREVIPVEYEYLGSVNEGLLNFKKDKKFGFIDKTNKIVIPAMYEDFSAFSEGLAAVKTSDGKYGYIDKSNKMIIAAEYEDASHFNYGYAAVAKKKGYSMGGAGKQTVRVPGEWVLINKTGKVIQQKTFEKISSRQGGGLFVIELNGKKGVMDSTGNPILPIGYKSVDVDKHGYIIFKGDDGKAGMMSSRGASILQPKYDYISHTSYARYYAMINGKYQVGDMNGNIFIQPDSASGVILGKKRIVMFYPDKAKVYDLNGNHQKTFDLNLKGYGHSLTVTEDSIKLNGDAAAQLINLTNNSKKQLGFGEAGDFNEDGIFVGKKQNNRYEFYDHSGKKISPDSYYSVVNFSEGIAALQLTSTSAPYLADRNFKKIKDLFLYFKGPYSEGLAYATSGQSGMVHYLDKNGFEVFSLKGRQGSKATGGFIVIKDVSGMYFYVNRAGKRMSTKNWDEANEFHEGLALVKFNGKWGYIDTLGNTVIPLNYDLASDFTKGAAMVKQNNKFFLINKKGEPIGTAKYENAGNPGNGTFPVQKNNLAGLIDSKGNVIIDFKYNSILYMSEDRVWAAKDGKWGLLDNKGKELTGFLYQGAYDFQDGYARVVLNDKLGLVNKAGKLVLPADNKSLSSVYKNMIIAIRPAETITLPIK
jgi:WG containing repeat